MAVLMPCLHVRPTSKQKRSSISFSFICRQGSHSTNTKTSTHSLKSVREHTHKHLCPREPNMMCRSLLNTHRLKLWSGIQTRADDLRGNAEEMSNSAGSLSSRPQDRFLRARAHCQFPRKLLRKFAITKYVACTYQLFAYFPLHSGQHFAKFFWSPAARPEPCADRFVERSCVGLS